MFETTTRKHNAMHKGAQGSNDRKVMKGRGHTSCLMLIKYFTGFTTEKLSSSLRERFAFFFLPQYSPCKGQYGRKQEDIWGKMKYISNQG